MNNVLTFWDFFWIWIVVIMAAGGSKFVGGDQIKDQITNLENKVDKLSEEIRKLSGGSA